MTIEDKISIMQQFKDGKRVQKKLKIDHTWDDDLNPVFDFENYDYRICEDNKYRKMLKYLEESDIPFNKITLSKVVRDGREIMVMDQKSDILEAMKKAFIPYRKTVFAIVPIYEGGEKLIRKSKELKELK